MPFSSVHTCTELRHTQKPRPHFLSICMLFLPIRTSAIAALDIACSSASFFSSASRFMASSCICRSNSCARSCTRRRSPSLFCTTSCSSLMRSSNSSARAAVSCSFSRAASRPCMRDTSSRDLFCKARVLMHTCVCTPTARAPFQRDCSCFASLSSAHVAVSQVRTWLSLKCARGCLSSAHVAVMTPAAVIATKAFNTSSFWIPANNERKHANFRV